MLTIKTTDRVVVLTGSELSEECGVPRLKETLVGPWAGRPASDFASLSEFKKNPKTVLDWYEWRVKVNLYKAVLSPSYKVLAQFQKLIPNFTLITQAVDGLHWRAGNTGVIEINGNIHRMRCVDNGHLHRWDKRVDGNIPHCDLCKSILRPDVLFFDEFIDRQKQVTIHEAVRACDLLVIIGTSTKIYPAAGYIDIARSRQARVVVVSEDSPDARQLDLGLFLKGKAADVLPRIHIE